MKKTIHIFSSLLMVSILLSCLPLQKEEKYTGKSLDIYQHKTCWEYIESNPDDLSAMKAAIELCGMKEYYAQEKAEYTYLLLSNAALDLSEVEDARSNPALLQELKELLLFHIIKGTYHSYGILTYEITFVETLSTDPDKLMSLSLKQSASDRNNLERLNVMVDCGSSTVVMAVTSNLIMDNGPAHLMNNKCEYVP